MLTFCVFVYFLHQVQPRSPTHNKFNTDNELNEVNVFPFFLKCDNIMVPWFGFITFFILFNFYSLVRMEDWYPERRSKCAKSVERFGSAHELTIQKKKKKVIPSRATYFENNKSSKYLTLVLFMCLFNSCF